MSDRSSLATRLFDDADTRPIDPFDLFDEWLALARGAEVNDPTAAALATVDAAGRPDARMVLINAHDRRGFCFFTNLESAKANQLAATASAALLFHWKSLRRQVRLRGAVTPVTAEEGDAYFATRPRAAQLGAHASRQSRPLASREALMAAVATQAARWEAEVPRPAHWSGFRLVPGEFEFWQDGAARLHDRVRFARPEDGGPWTRQRLYP